jgi:WD40 repeat protein
VIAQLLYRIFIWVDFPLRILFGRDIFISYSRRDGGEAYAARLAKELGEDFSCYLDQLDTPRGPQLPRQIRRELRRSRALVLLGTRAAVESLYVKLEVSRFLQTRRKIILVDVDGSLQQVSQQGEPWSKLVGVFRAPEARDASVPTPPVIGYIRDSFVFTRQDQRLRRVAWLTAVGVVLMLLAAYRISINIVDKANAKASDAESRAGAAEVRERDAADREQAAQIRANDAALRENDANTRAGVAQDRADEATSRAEQARQQEVIARANAAQQQKIATSRQVAGYASTILDDEPDLSLLLGAAAYQTFPTLEARRSLLRGLTRYTNLSALARGGTDKVRSIARSLDSSLVISGSGNGSVLLWDAAERKLIAHLAKPIDLAVTVAFSPDGTKAAWGDAMGRLFLWNPRTGAVLKQVDSQPPVYCLAFNGEDQVVTNGSEDLINFWDIHDPANPKPLEPLHTKNDQIVALALSPDGRWLVSSHNGGRLLLFDLHDRGAAPVQLGGYGSAGWQMAFDPHPGSSILAVIGLNDRLMLFDVAKRKPIELFGRHLAEKAGQCLAFSPDGKRLATGSESGSIQLWDLSGLRERKYDTWDLYEGQRVGDYKAEVSSLVFLNDSELVSGHGDGTLGFWRTDGTFPSRQIHKMHKIPDRYVQATALSPDGKTMALGDDKGQVSLWRLEGNDAPFAMSEKVHTNSVRSLAFSPDGRLLASSGPDQKLALWDVAQRCLISVSTPKSGEKWRYEEEVQARVTNPAIIYSMAFGPGRRGGLLVSRNGLGDITLWDVSDPQHVEEITTHRLVYPCPPVFSSDGKAMALGDARGNIFLFDLDRKDLGGPPITKAKRPVHSIGFAQGGDRLIVVDQMGAILTMNLRARSIIPEPLYSSGGESIIMFAAVSSDGKTVAIREPRDQVALWDIDTQTRMGELSIGQSGYLLGFSPNNKSLVCLSQNKLILYDLDPEQWGAIARQIGNRELSAGEKAQFVINKKNDAAVPRRGFRRQK